MSVEKNENIKVNKVKIAPVITTDEAKVIIISGAAGDKLERHKVNDNGLLLVKSGRILYAEEERELELTGGAGHSIPAEVVHAITCLSAAEFFVIIPNRAKIKFSR